MILPLIIAASGGATTGGGEPTDPGAPTIPFNLATATHKIVRTGGTVGVDCDYTTITAALAAITTASVSNQFVLDVKNGTYNETGTFSIAFSLYIGMTLKDYIHIVGESEDGVHIYGPPQDPGNESIADVFHIPATCLVKNMTVHAYDVKYPFHCDENNIAYDMYFENVTTYHDHSNDGYLYDVGVGIYGDQRLTFINCTRNGGGFFGHGNLSSARDLSKHFEIEDYQSTGAQWQWLDTIEYAANKITLTNCTIGEVYLRTDTTVYDANPGNPACNTGTKVYTNFIVSGNDVTTVTRDSETAAILGTTMDDPTDFV